MKFIQFTLLFLAVLAKISALKPLVFNLPSDSPSLREATSTLISTKIKQVFPNRKDIPYACDGYAGVEFYYTQPSTTTVMQYGDAQLHYNIYTRNNNSNTYTHFITIINSVNDSQAAAEVVIKIFQSKISFSAKKKGSMSLVTYDLINKLENAVIDLSKETATLDQYQFKRLVEYIR
ncbi:hypothetical protein NEIG_00949 [Nematocida sp. ERTm5]|nr:hypothetical protein NEIRO02_0387 [Nematocida sp. AWRm79]KAI5182718.1 hypothetical protein NEIRO03_0369 [Nematocida sp. AWRm78]OAG33394.1 hypothetical protein NEIG_00949 [Nematocida sp. ERTm5]